MISQPGHWHLPPYLTRTRSRIRRVRSRALCRRSRSRSRLLWFVVYSFAFVRDRAGGATFLVRRIILRSNRKVERMRLALLGALFLTMFSNACSDRNADSTRQERPCTARYVPVGNDPDIALDTQTGSLCRTVADTNDPLGIRDAACGVTPEMKKVGFVPNGCKGGQTWVKGEGDKKPSRYTGLPVCSKIIVVTPADMKQAEGK